MTDAYLAPTDLTDARRRLEELVNRRGEQRGFSPDDPEAVVRLRPRSVDEQLRSLPTGTACVVADLALWRAEATSLRALADALHPDGTLLFIEPTADLGWRSALHRFGRPLWRLRFGHDFTADVPALLRAAGLIVTTTDRFGVGFRGLRSYVQGEARHFPNL
ncbi:MAG: hypothetical protein AAF531_11445 [Actinomycetota bacterium]